MKKIVIIILGVLVSLSAVYIFKLKRQIIENETLIVKYHKTLDSLTAKDLDNLAQQKYLEALVDRNLAMAKLKLEEVRKKGK